MRSTVQQRLGRAEAVSSPIAVVHVVVGDDPVPEGVQARLVVRLWCATEEGAAARRAAVAAGRSLGGGDARA